MKAESIKPRFSIFPFTLPSGAEVFRVTGVKRDGKQVRERLKTLEAATARQQELEAEYRGLEKTTRLVDTRLTPEQIADAEAARKILGDKFALTFVADWFQKNYKESAVKILVADARDKFIAEKRKANKRERTIGDLEDRISQIAKAYPTKHVHEITRDDLLHLINKPDAPQTRKNLRTVFFGFFKWCASQHFCPANIVETIAKPETETPEPEILSLAACRKLLEAASDYKDGVCLPYVTLGLFCAIRPAELARITWDDICLESKTVTLSAKIAKKRKKRIVEISDNAIEFLLPHAVKKTPIQGVNWRRDFDKVKEQAKLSDWPQDVMRHTGISHHFAFHQHEGKTASWAGNSPNVIHEHYKALVKQPEAAEFWQIKPGAKIVELKAA